MSTIRNRYTLEQCEDFIQWNNLQITAQELLDGIHTARINLDALNLDRGTLRLEARDEAALISAAETSLTLLESVKTEFNTQRSLCEKLGIYYGYHKRNQKKAMEFFIEFKKHVRMDTLDDARAFIYLAYTQSIQGSYHDTSLLDSAQRILNTLYQNSENDSLTIAEIQIEQGYLACFLGLFHYRKSFLLVENSPAQKAAYLSQALEYMQIAIIIQEAVFVPDNDDLHKQITIEMANSFHITGIIQDKSGNFVKGLEAYEKAMQLEQWFEEAVGHKHFLSFVTKQNYARTLTLNFNRADDAVLLLNGVLREQKEYYKDPATGEPTDNFDIAKSFHFRGEANAKSGRPIMAMDSFQQSLDMKMRLGSSKIAYDVIDTQKCLLEAATAAWEHTPDDESGIITQAVKSIDLFDWENFHTIKPFQSLLPLLQPLTSNLVALFRSKEELDNESEPEPFPQDRPRLKDLMQSLVPVLYQIGTYVVHLVTAPSVAQFYLDAALDFNETDELLALWINNHLGLLAQQRLAESYNKSDEDLQDEFDEYQETFGYTEEVESSPDEIKTVYWEAALADVNEVLQGLQENLETHKKLKPFANFVSAIADYEFEKHVAESNQLTVLQKVLRRVTDLVKLHEDINDVGEQYLRVKTMYASLLAEFKMLLEGWSSSIPEEIRAFAATLPTPLSIYQSIDVARQLQKNDKSNPLATGFYYSYAVCLTHSVLINQPQGDELLSSEEYAAVKLGFKKCTQAVDILTECNTLETSIGIEAVQLQEFLQALIVKQEAHVVGPQTVGTARPSTTGLFSTSAAQAAAIQQAAATQVQQSTSSFSISPGNG